MSPANLDRVLQARRRLRSAIEAPNSDDPAIRLVELTSPLVGETALELDRSFSVVSGLSESGRQALAATIDALRLNDESLGLTGIVEVRGERQPLHVVAHAPQPGVALVPTRAFLGRTASRSAEAAQLADVIETIDLAVLLSAAELRGADAAFEELRSRVSSERSVPVVQDDDSAEAHHVVAALDQVLPDAAHVQRVADALSALQSDAGRIRLQAACSQAQAAKSQLLPGDGRDAAMLADLVAAEADGSLAEYDMLPGSLAHELASCLLVVDIDVSPADAPEYARRVLEECAELQAIRAQAMQTIESSTVPASPDEIDRQTRLHAIDGQRSTMQRRLRSQQQMLAVAREEWTRAGIGVIDLRSAVDLETANRPLPILVEEPLFDLPARLSGAILSTLLHHSAQTQVICVSDQVDLRRWCDSVGDRAGWVEAHGWFAGSAE